jgi:DNA invertase Pin-like site-specific DNA recombinase
VTFKPGRATDNGVEAVKTVQDAGVSGRRNRIESALAGFVEQIGPGAVEPRSYLLIKSLDRLSRAWTDFRR